LKSPFQEYEDAFRNKSGVFIKTINALKYAKKSNIRVSVLCAISKYNMNYVDELLDLLFSLEVDFVALLYTSPFGRAGSGCFSITPREWKEVCELIEKKRYEAPKNTEVVYEPVFCSDYDFGNFCSLYSKKYMAIDAQGNVYFCPLFMNSMSDRYSLGNIFEKNLIDIWQHSIVWDKFRKLKDSLCSCHTCSKYNLCGGECFANLVFHKKQYNYPKAVCYMYWRFPRN
jgi:radical SAM protein with 4Fe4S-binding SPASM domain